MRILFLSHYFPPEVNAPATRTFEHCREWVALGHEVHVVTCVPSHPRGIPFPGYRRGWYQREEQAGIVVHRVWTFLAANRGVFRRTLNYLTFAPSAVWRSLQLGRFDVIIATSPQFLCAVAGHVAARLKRTPWIFELRDLWPHSIAVVGAFRQRALLRMLESIELHLYRSARLVVCLTRSFIENLEKRGIPAAKLAFVPNGVETSAWNDGEREAVRGRLGFNGREFLVGYIGTIGMAHGLDTVLRAASLAAARRPEVRFLIVGDGAELSALVERARVAKLANVSFTGLVPRAEVPGYMAASDAALVTLKRSDLFRTVLPSKLFEAMAAGRPVLLGVEGEAEAVLRRAGAGLAFRPEDPEALCEAIANLADHPEKGKAMGAVGRAFVEREFSRRAWALAYAGIIESIAGSAGLKRSGSSTTTPQMNNP